MHQPPEEYSDETTPAILELVAGFGGVPDAAQAIGLAAIAQGERVVFSHKKEGDVFDGLTTELLISAGQTDVGPVMASALSRYVKAGVQLAVSRDMIDRARGVFRAEGEDDPTTTFLQHTQGAIADGSLFKHLAEIVATQGQVVPPQESEELGFFAQRRAARAAREAAAQREIAEKHAADERCRQRQTELMQLRLDSRQEGMIGLDDIKPGDNVTLTTAAHPMSERQGKCTLRLKAEGYQDITEGQYRGTRAVLFRVEAEYHTQGAIIDREPLPFDAEVLLVGTKIPTNDFWRDKGMIGQGQTPIILWGGREVAFKGYPEPKKSDGHNFWLKQLDIEVGRQAYSMFKDKHEP